MIALYLTRCIPKGFKDGISSPCIKSLSDILPGQIEIKPGVLICGQEGDEIKDRPSWTKNGSFLVYRQLNQFVPEFNKFLFDNPVVAPSDPRIPFPPDWTHEKGSELTGARMVGRWKSGAPLDITPFKDVPELGANEKKNNKFDFSESEALNDQTKCPYAAHIRKTNPRQDLRM